ncbi:hypothetical protein [Burkholderia ambifaria]|uniref:Uncharacterized protein n=1 Tax=Burkholderia ambifaria MEX-5 TaxID=396597 RepID=B1T4F8_9BURK|nr:hypothetical protein [Burkholderia ambifaria]EDT41556.1 hypothetical protein BamMEX5DRAFT_2674 [Burkholderia ambifaria MEX-5]
MFSHQHKTARIRRAGSASKLERLDEDAIDAGGNSQGYETIFHIVDTRDDNAVASKAVMDFEFPQIQAGDTVGYYLQRSTPGNMFTGVVNIKTGVVDIYPLDPDRNDMIDFEWGQKCYQGKTHDGDRPIRHPGRGTPNWLGSDAIQRVSHLQLISKLPDKNHGDYVGFTLSDVRSLRKESNKWKNDQVSFLYGASRSLNTTHVSMVNDNAIPYKTNKLSYQMNKGVFTYLLPIEFKRRLLSGLVETLGAGNPRKIFIASELDREELNIESYAKAKAPKIAHFYV